MTAHYRSATSRTTQPRFPSGWIVLRGKRWYGYYRRQVIHPTTGDVRVRIVPIRLGLKSQMTKLAGERAAR
ncbi:hypothetical protein JAO29_10135 [Edaphobacter sp. HDX4]|uniref:hypothetical protein n=1 Tax=Edaphobacter sp. HDX4 TaxID=2794064 RepID=UPI002FE54E85